MKITATNANRALYNALIEQKNQGKFAKDAIITMSYLRFETVLTSSQNVIFNVLSNQGNGVQRSTEKRLNTPDAFIVSDFGFMIKKVTATTTDAQAKLFSYPEPSVFTGTEAKNLENLWNGYLTVKIDQTTWIDSLDMKRFYNVGQAQQGLAVSANATANLYQNSEWSHSSWGFDGLEPAIRFDGASNNDVTINLPESLNMAGAANESNIAVLMVRGYLIQRGSKFFVPLNKA